MRVRLLHLSERHRETLLALLRTHLPEADARASGRRVNGRSHDGSDLDIVLRGPGLAKIPEIRLAGFEYAIHESRIPFLVEVRDWASLPERFHLENEREHVVLEKGAGGKDLDPPTHSRNREGEIDSGSVINPTASPGVR